MYICCPFFLKFVSFCTKVKNRIVYFDKKDFYCVKFVKTFAFFVICAIMIVKLATGSEKQAF